MVSGSVDPAFSRVKDAFASLFADGLENGAAVACVVDGRIVADLWGGHADASTGKPWQRDTIANVWSVTKGVVATAIAIAVERGLLAYDRPIADVWPEFAANGKEAIDLDLVMSHQAGLNGLSVPMSAEGLYAWHPYVEALAAMAPLWEPGSRCAYHALSYGHLAGEPLRRVSGKSVGRFITDEIASPLNLDLFVGLPGSEDHRAARLIDGPGASDWVADMLSGNYPHSCANPELKATAPNERAFRAAEIPGGNGHSDARSLARLYGDLTSGRSALLSPAGLSAATRIRFDGEDISFQSPSTFGAGFAIGNEEWGPASKKSFGHNGWGGSMAFGDPEARVGFAYVTSDMRGFDTVDPRRARLTEAVYAAL